MVRRVLASWTLPRGARKKPCFDLPNILSYFHNPITNAASEAINSTIQTVKKHAFGFRGFPNFRNAVLFRCGGLDLYPRSSTHPNPR